MNTQESRNQTDQESSVVRKNGICTACLLFLTVLAALLLTSCPNPLPLNLATQITDSTGPQILISSPHDGETYQSTVTVTGSVSDPNGAVESLALNVPALDLAEPVIVGEDGSFTYTFSTSGVTTAVAITLAATDWNGNTTTASLTLENDLTGPSIRITEPEDYSAYSTVVRVSGTVTDTEGSTSTGEVSSCSYRIPGTSLAGDLALGDGGGFTFEFATRLADGTQVLEGPAAIEITAEDCNGNTTTSSVTIVRPNTGDISGFTVTPGNRQVTIEWDPVLYAESYSIHNPRYGEIRENVTSPYVWDGLENGELYNFQLQAVLPPGEGVDAWSDTEDVIPLSERTLAPDVIETAYRSITIRWNPINAASEYTVERSENGGPWFVRTITDATTLLDADLTHDTSYAYRVKPIEQADIPSASVAAMPARFPPGGVMFAGDCDTLVEAYGVAVSGSYAYVADESDGLQVIDISDPSSASIVGSYDTVGTAYGVVISGSYAYVADGSSGLQVIDISNPADPIWVNECDTDGLAFGVAVAGTCAYVADMTAGLQIIDVSDLGSPLTISGTYDTPGYAQGVAVSGDYAYVADYDGGLQIIDISTPTEPMYKNSLTTSGYAQGVAISIADSGPSYAYVAEVFSSALEVIDISDLASLTSVGSCSTAGTPAGVAVSGTYAYVADGSGLQLISILDPTTPKVVGGYDTPGVARGVTVAGSYAYVADDTSGLQVFTITNPGSPVFADSYWTGIDLVAWDVAVSGPYAYLVGSYLDVVDVSDPAAVSFVGHCDTGGYQVVTSGSYAYVAAGLQIISVSDPSAPAWVGGYDTGGSTPGIAVSGRYAYVPDRTQGFQSLQILDISDPASPVLIGTCDAVADPFGVAVSGSYAYVADDTNGLQVIDVSDPASPALVGGGYDTPGNARRVAVSGSYAYVADGSSGLQVINISTPGTPTYAGHCDTPWFAQGVAISGSYAYVADSGGLRVIDIHDPTNPILVGGCDTSGETKGVAVSGSYAYVATNDQFGLYGGLMVIDLLGGQ